MFRDSIFDDFFAPRQTRYCTPSSHYYPTKQQILQHQREQEEKMRRQREYELRLQREQELRRRQQNPWNMFFQQPQHEEEEEEEEVPIFFHQKPKLSKKTPKQIPIKEKTQTKEEEEIEKKSDPIQREEEKEVEEEEEEEKRIPSEEPLYKKIEQVSIETDKFIQEIQNFKEGKLQYKDYEYEVLKFDELLTRNLCKLDVIQGSSSLMKKRKERVLKIVNALKVVDELKKNIPK
jgi:hypothetical protein